MRLQVSIKRHALPRTKIIFTTRALGPSPATSSTDATIAQLLEDVNDIVPLEFADWGLEDYAVEVKGYECLHFSPINAVLRDDDQIVIRALKTQDLRSRRLGGRHQISSDGRHLIDGVAFGRQWLKKGGRPPVPIPPRKRRLKIGGAEHNEGPETGPLALTVISDANDLDNEDSDGEEDSDFVDEDGDVLGQDGSRGETGPDFVIDTEPDLQIVARQDFEDADDESRESDEEHTSDEDLAGNERSEQDTELSAELQALREDEESQNANVRGRRQNIPQHPSRSDGSDIRSGGRKRKRTVDYDSEDLYGSEFNGFSSPLTRRVKAPKVPPASNADLDSTSSSDSDSDEDSELGASVPFPKKRQSLDGSAHSDALSDSSEETSSCDSNSDSDAASEDESSGSPSLSSKTSDVVDPNEEATLKAPPASNPLILVQESSASSIATSSVNTRPPVPPGQGSRRTRYSNQRQKKRYRLQKLKELGMLPENATFIDMAAYDEAQQTASLGPAAAVAKVVEMKKQELLGQVEEQVHEQEREPAQVQVQTQAQEHAMEQGSDMAWESSENIIRRRHSTTRWTETPFTDASSKQLRGPHTPLHERPAKDLIDSLLAPAVQTKSELSKQRTRLDLNSTRNMIFNGLGVRKPKTAAAEQALREKLAKPVKGALPKQLFKDAVMKQDGGSVESNNSQVPWEIKLVVSAVECEVDDVTLDEPPFPFFQGWDEDASKRLRNIKRKGRNQRQYYAYDDNRATDWYGEEPEEVQDQEDPMLYDHVDGADTLDQLTTKASNLIDEAHDQLDVRIGDPPTEDVENFPRPDNIGSLDTLQHGDALPFAVIAYKEFHLNTITFQPEISNYRLARIEAVREDGSLDLTLSKQDRKPPSVAKYDEETGKRILSRSEMFQGGDDADEDDGRRLLAYADLIEPKIVKVSTTSKPAANMSLGAGSQIPNGTLLSASGSAFVPESTVSDNLSFTSAQPPFQPVTAAETKNDVHIHVATPQRTEISFMMKEAGFDSNLDSELLRPIDGITDSAQHSSPGLDITREAMNQARKRSAEPVSETQHTAVDTSGFDSPRFNGWSSSPPIEPEPDEAIEETTLGQPPTSSQNCEAQPEEEEVANESLAPRNQVTYPHISQLELDASTQESPPAQLRGGGGQGSPGNVDEQENVVDLEDSGVEVVEDTHFDSLKSVVPPSVDESPEAEELATSNGHATAPFLDGLDGQISSDDDELPSLARITSTARSRSSQVSTPPVTRRRKWKATQRHKSTSPAYVESFASASQPPMKQSQSQVQLSQIPPGSQVVDLTFSSDPVSPGNSDGEYGKTKRLARSSNKVKTGTKGAGVQKSDDLAATLGLGNRRLLKSKKAKP